MRLTTRGRYAVTALLDLALQPTEQTITLAEIAARQTISVAYLEQLFAKLRRHQIVESVRGPGGGYCLARNALEISVADVILAVDEPMDATQCGGRENCKSDHRCMTHDLWATLNRKMLDYLASVSLSDLVDKQRQKASAQADKQTVSFSVAQAA